MIVAVAGQKGGSGKTTVSVNTAAEWHRRGKRTLLVDTDPQRTASTWSDVATEIGSKIPTVIAMGAGLHQPDQLPTLAEHFDVVVIDCPPRHGEIQRAALMIADLVVLPCGPGSFDAWALGESITLVSEAKMLRPQLRAAALINRKVANTTVGETAREVIEGTGLTVLETELGLRVAFQEAPSAGVGVTVYQGRGAAAKEIKLLCDELERVVAGEDDGEE